MFQGYLILIISQIDLLSKWPTLPNSLGKGGQLIGQKGPPTPWELFFILIHTCVHRCELNKTDMKKPFYLIYMVTCFVGHNSNNILFTFVYWDYYVKHAPIEI